MANNPKMTLMRLSAETTVMFTQLLEDDELVAMAIAGKDYTELLEHVNDNY